MFKDIIQGWWNFYLYDTTIIGKIAMFIPFIAILLALGFITLLSLMLDLTYRICIK